MYSRAQRTAIEVLLTLFCPIVSCLLVGLAAFGSGAFDPRAGAFQFVVTGLIVGALVLIARHLSSIQFVGATVLIVVAMIVVTPFSAPRLVLHTVVLMVALTGAVLVNVKVLARSARSHAIGKFIVWTVVFALAYFLAGVVLLIMFRPAGTVQYLLLYGKLAVLIGLGLGIGLAVQDWLTPTVPAAGNAPGEGPGPKLRSD
jgi:hypothetical protein